MQRENLSVLLLTLLLCQVQIRPFRMESLIPLTITQPYKKILHQQNTQARCLDGSPAAIYQHIGTQSKKFLLFFGGGGHCGGLTFSQTLQNCYQRSKTDLGSSRAMFDELRPQGMLSTDPTRSKFANWTKFIFAYCDGGFHQGYRPNSISYMGAQLFIRGQKNTLAHLQYIEKKYKLSEATDVVISGVSAGAIAAFQWTNFIQRTYFGMGENDLKQKSQDMESPFQNKTKQRSSPQISTIIDSGIFINSTTVDTGIYKSQIFLQNQFKLSNPTTGTTLTPFSQCNKISIGHQWDCMFLSHAYHLIRGPKLIIASLYDSYDLKYQYDIKCIVQGHEGMTFDMGSCTEKELRAIQERYDATNQLLDRLEEVDSSYSIWGISCANHVYVGSWKFYDSENQTTLKENVGVKEAVERFVLGSVEKGMSERFVVRDRVKWPGNKKCAY